MTYLTNSCKCIAEWEQGGVIKCQTLITTTKNRKLLRAIMAQVLKRAKHIKEESDDNTLIIRHRLLPLLLALRTIKTTIICFLKTIYNEKKNDQNVFWRCFLSQLDLVTSASKD